MTHEIQCKELGEIAVPDMRIKVRWFPTGVSNGQVWRAPSNVLSFSQVVGEPVQHRDVSKAAASFHPAGPLTFWPRTAVWESRRNRSQVLTVSAYFDSNLGFEPSAMQPGEIVVDDYSMMEMMQMLHDEVRMPSSTSREFVTAIGAALRVKLARLLDQHVHAPKLGKPCRSTGMTALHRLINDSDRLPNTTQLAAQIGTSRRNLQRIFKATTGVSPSVYLSGTKLEKAKTLLATSTLPMKQVAYKAGFATASHFATKFRRATGVTPSAFRRRSRGDLRPA